MHKNHHSSLLHHLRNPTSHQNLDVCTYPSENKLVALKNRTFLYQRKCFELLGVLVPLVCDGGCVVLPIIRLHYHPNTHDRGISKK